MHISVGDCTLYSVQYTIEVLCISTYIQCAIGGFVYVTCTVQAIGMFKGPKVIVPRTVLCTAHRRFVLLYLELYSVQCIHYISDII